MAEPVAPEPICLVLDTSVFSNPDTGQQFGPTTAKAVAAFVELAGRAAGRVRCAMPPSIFAELKTFMEASEVPNSFEYVVALRAPVRHGVVVPGFLLYELIEDIRQRIDRGLRVAEKAVHDAHPTNVDTTINRLRSEYREALRAGLLDSREDIDLILLARQLDGALVSSDRAVVTWAEKLGIRLISPHQLRALLESLE